MYEKWQPATPLNVAKYLVWSRSPQFTSGWVLLGAAGPAWFVSASRFRDPKHPWRGIQIGSHEAVLLDHATGQPFGDHGLRKLSMADYLVLQQMLARWDELGAPRRRNPRTPPRRGRRTHR